MSVPIWVRVIDFRGDLTSVKDGPALRNYKYIVDFDLYYSHISEEASYDA